MPLEVHDYLVAQGWGGKGTGLRHGAISRPLAIPQKKTLAGLGKDRDEAFPFWDHLFSAAAKSIQLKCDSDDEEEEDEETPASTGVSLRKTKTGIFSTRRPVDGTPADSGATTPNEADTDSSTPRLSLMALAKRDAAKRRLYAQFFRGPVLGPETIAEEERRLAELVQEAFDKQNPHVECMTITEHIEVKMADENVVIDLEVSKFSKKRKAMDTTEEISKSDGEDEEERKERKLRRKEKKRRKEEKEAAKLKRRQEKREKKEKQAATESVPLDTLSSSKCTEEVDAKYADSKSERRLKKEEKRKRKLSRHQEDLATDVKMEAGTLQLTSPRKDNLNSLPKSGCATTDDTKQASQDRKRKKKRKLEDNPNDSK